MVVSCQFRCQVSLIKGFGVPDSSRAVFSASVMFCFCASSSSERPSVNIDTVTLKFKTGRSEYEIRNSDISDPHNTEMHCDVWIIVVSYLHHFRIVDSDSRLLKVLDYVRGVTHGRVSLDCIQRIHHQSFRVQKRLQRIALSMKRPRTTLWRSGLFTLFCKSRLYYTSSLLINNTLRLP
jgi:hypothetical protein